MTSISGPFSLRRGRRAGRHTRPARLGPGAPLGFFTGVVAALLPLADAAAQTTRQAVIPRRVVKHFDFDEQAAGNLESTPLFWRRRVQDDLSLFLEGRFDSAVFHEQAPSFRLDLDGGSIAYEYFGTEVVLHAPAPYMVTGWIRASGLETARAYLTACYLDRKKNPIPATERRSALVGGPGAAAGWHAVAVNLPADLPEARYVSVSLWLAQERIWNTVPRAPRSIDLEDVAGSAWFDDITVFPCPHVALRAADPSHAFTGDARLDLEVSNPSPDRLRLSARLTLCDIDGHPVEARVLDLSSPVTSEILTFSGLPVGLYRAALSVDADNLRLIGRELTFVCMSDAAGVSQAAGRGLGIVLDGTRLELLDGQMGLLRHLRPEFVKMPLQSLPSNEANLAAGSPGERYRQEIAELRAEPITVLADPQAPVQTQPADLEKGPGIYTELTLPSGTPVDDIEAYLSGSVADRRSATWITVQPPPESAYGRELRRADLARRLVEAAWQNTAAVFLQAPWTSHRNGESACLVPSEDFLVARTAFDALGGSVPVSRLQLDGRVHGILLDRHGRSVLFAWDPTAPPEGREHVWPLGDAVRQVDLLGRAMPVGRLGGQRVVRIGPSPTYILDAPTWLIDFRHHFQLDPPVLQISLEPATPVVRFRNTSRQTVAGSVRLVGPPGWQLHPTRLTFTLQPGEELSRPVQIRIPQNASADATPIVGEFEVVADRRYGFLLPTWVRSGMEGVDLETYLQTTGDGVMISLHVTNRGVQDLQLEAHLLAPGRNREVRQLTHFPAGQTMTERFHVERAGELSGQNVRLTLKEKSGSRSWSRVFALP